MARAQLSTARLLESILRIAGKLSYEVSKKPALEASAAFSSSFHCRASVPGLRESVACGSWKESFLSNNGIISRQLSSQGAASAKKLDIDLIKQLREMTGAGMKDVKTALVSCDWDLEKAKDHLRTKGLAAATKKASRVAAEGLLGLAQTQGGLVSAIVEINSETDFVARGDLFRHLVQEVSRTAADLGSKADSVGVSKAELEAATLQLSHPKLTGQMTVQNAVAEVASITGENIVLRDATILHVSPNEVAGTYLHLPPVSGLAEKAAVVVLKSDSTIPPEKRPLVQGLAEDIAMHVMAAQPVFLQRSEVATEVLDREMAVLRSQAMGLGKPETVVAKMVEGRLRKFYEETVLLEQKYVQDESTSVEKLLKQKSKEWNLGLSIGLFTRQVVGAGIERAEKDFAAEVRAQLGESAA